jgi:hypothetical protein
MAITSYQGPDPTRYYMAQQERRDEQLRNIMNMIMMMQRWKASQEQQGLENEFTRRRLGLEQERIDLYNQGLTQREKPSTSQEEIDRLISIGIPREEAVKHVTGYETEAEKDTRLARREEIRAKIGAKYRQPTKEPDTTSTYKAKLFDIEQRYDAEQRGYDKTLEGEISTLNPDNKDDVERHDRLVFAHKKLSEKLQKDKQNAIDKLNTIYEKAKPTASIPKEVSDYMGKHKEVTLEQAMKLYIEWKGQK